MLPLLPREVQPGGPRVSDVRAGLSPCLGWLLQGPGLGFAVPLSPWDRLKQASSWGRPLNQAGTWQAHSRRSGGGAGRAGVRQGGASRGGGQQGRGWQGRGQAGRGRHLRMSAREPGAGLPGAAQCPAPGRGLRRAAPSAPCRPSLARLLRECPLPAFPPASLRVFSVASPRRGFRTTSHRGRQGLRRAACRPPGSKPGSGRAGCVAWS